MANVYIMRANVGKKRFNVHTPSTVTTQINMKAQFILGLLASLAAATPTVYFIRHGEKPSSGNGLSSQGLQRAQCLKTVFGASSQYNIGYIMAQTPRSGP